MWNYKRKLLCEIDTWSSEKTKGGTNLKQALSVKTDLEKSY